MPDATAQLRVLVIDDSVDNADAMSAVLAMMGCETAVAYGGAQGIVEAAQFEPHVAFIDFEMPGMDGCDVARHLRAKHPELHTRLICLTGRGQVDDRRMCMAAGFDDFYTKPMESECLALILAAEAARRGRGRSQRDPGRRYVRAETVARVAE